MGIKQYLLPILFLILVALALCQLSCYPPGTITVSGYTDAKMGPTVVRKGQNISVNAGVPNKVDQALRQLSFLPWLGGACVLVGMGLLVAKRWLPLLPSNAAWILLVGGVCITALPLFLDRFLNPVIAVLALVGLGLVYVVHMWIVAWLANKNKQGATPKETT